MCVRVGLIAVFLVVSFPAAALAEGEDGQAEAEAGEAEVLHEDRWIFTARAEFAHLRGHDEDFFMPGGGLGVIAPIPDTPLGIEGVASLVTGDGNLVGIIDLGLRFFLPSGGMGSDAVGAFFRVGPTLDIIDWDHQDVTIGVGGMFGLGLTVWATDLVGLLIELSYRVTGGTELNQIAAATLGVAIAP